MNVKNELSVVIQSACSNMFSLMSWSGKAKGTIWKSRFPR